jgi:hypothetical protein
VPMEKSGSRLSWKLVGAGVLYFSDRVSSHGSRTDLSVGNFRVMSRKNSACGARRTPDRDTRVLYTFDYVMAYS